MNNSKHGLVLLLFILGLLVGGCNGADSSEIVFLETVWEGDEHGQGVFDLDAGEFDATGLGDLMLYAGAGSATFFAFIPENGARAVPMGNALPSLEDCLSVLENAVGGSVPEIWAGNHLCVRTTEGNIAVVVILGRDVGKRGMKIQYALWSVSDR